MLDVVLASAALVLASPLFLTIAWKVKRESPGPVFFRQQRLGMHMREFTILKFRTMYVGTAESPHHDYIRQTMNGDVPRNAHGLYKLEREDSVTPFGRWLRRTSLDELPQLFNVLRGEMSLVGPRPCIPYEVEYFELHHMERFLVPAGMTGLWQVTERGRASFREAVELDVLYVRRFSLMQDLRILAVTPRQVLRLNGTV